MIGSVLGENRWEHILDDREHILLGGESHLHIQLIKFAGRAVAAGIFVSKTGGDLKIAVKAGGHQKLLKLLRRLGQRVKHPRMLAGRHQIVPCTFGGGSGQNRGGDLQKIVFHHGFAQSGYHVAAQHDVLFDRRVAQIQIAVAQPLGLVRLSAAVDLKRKLVVAAAAQHLDLGRHHFNVSGRLLRVFAGALPHNADDL